MTNIFSVSAFFIVLREVLEACLVVGVVLAYLSKCGADHMRKWVWIGTITGIAISLGVGIAFAIVFYASGNTLFSGAAEKIFEGFIFLVAAGLLTWMIIWMMLVGKNFQKKMHAQIDRALTAGSKWSIFLLVGVQVLREGIETFIFLLGAANADESGGWRAIPIPFIVALITGIVLSYLLFKGLLNMNVKGFFIWSSLLLVAFCAGLVSHAFHEFQEVDWLGPFEDVENEERDWWNKEIMNLTDCCNDKSNQFFAMLRALFGYQDKPTFIEIITYIAYWVFILTVLIVVFWNDITNARDKIAKITKIFATATLAFFFVCFIYAVGNVTWNGVLFATLGLIFSTLAFIASIDFATRALKFLKNYRRPMAYAAAVGLTMLLVLTFCIIIAHMSCEDKDCKFPLFYYWLFIFGEDWSANNTIILLSICLGITLFLFGLFCFALTLFAGNVTGEGDYMYQNMGEQLKQVDEEDASPQEFSTNSSQEEEAPVPGVQNRTLAGAPAETVTTTTEVVKKETVEVL